MYYTYITTNDRRTVLYTGMTKDLMRRMEEHRRGKGPSFAARYNAARLVWFQGFPTARQAIDEEKRIKGGSRAKKIALIEEVNPSWEDLSYQL